jgi:hypothetical protein
VLNGPAPGVGIDAVSGAADVDGDGRADLAVGSAAADGSGGGESGRVRIVDAAGAELAVIDGLEPRDWLGAALALADVDGDGAPDLVIGAPGHDDEPSKKGRVLVLSGAPRGK